MYNSLSIIWDTYEHVIYGGSLRQKMRNMSAYLVELTRESEIVVSAASLKLLVYLFSPWIVEC